MVRAVGLRLLMADGKENVSIPKRKVFSSLSCFFFCVVSAPAAPQRTRLLLCPLWVAQRTKGGSLSGPGGSARALPPARSRRETERSLLLDLLKLSRLCFSSHSSLIHVLSSLLSPQPPAPTYNSVSVSHLPPRHPIFFKTHFWMRRVPGSTRPSKRRGGRASAHTAQDKKSPRPPPPLHKPTDSLPAYPLHHHTPSYPPPTVQSKTQLAHFTPCRWGWAPRGGSRWPRW